MEEKATALLCPNCGYAFNERRTFDRKEKSVNVFFFGYAPQAAITRDISRSGARIAYKGGPLVLDTVLNFKIESLTARKSAKVVWSRKMGKRISESGLRFVTKGLII